MPKVRLYPLSRCCKRSLEKDCCDQLLSCPCMHKYIRNGSGCSFKAFWMPLLSVSALLIKLVFLPSGNAGLCGIPGLPTCGAHLSTGSKAGIALGAFIALALIFICSICWWKRRQNILRAQKLAARDAPYAKARTHFVRDMQMTRPCIQGQARVAAEIGPHLLLVELPFAFGSTNVNPNSVRL
ncbi:receptor-like protein 4 isoform X2 [Magnolia sinica]|uniref:receptor-like protein 4 isoform X2 n=1 Tax=Magnolia sinica TaxID=86752 RepID=UPI00265A9EA2|nr:receptor-like protein 4 isoform X2 [Magnolia sinica]